MRTLSGGEAQRIHLATQLGSQLVGTQYVLDEPTIGLHPRDTEAMGIILRELAERGNTVIVVEHDPQIIQQADYVVELGPQSGDQGGQVVCAAPYQTFLKHPQSLTAQYLRGRTNNPLSFQTSIGKWKGPSAHWCERTKSQKSHREYSTRHASLCHGSFRLREKHNGRSNNLCSPRSRV